MSNTKNTSTGAQVPRAFLGLCLGVLPVWIRQLEISRAQSERAVSQMMQAFADIGPPIYPAEGPSRKTTETFRSADGGSIGLVPACERALQPLLADAHMPVEKRQELQQALDVVRGAISALHTFDEPAHPQTKPVADAVERMYQGFQYQDRISQMLALLQADMVRLQQAAVSDEPLPDLQTWLSRLESQYVMAEQRQTHNLASHEDDDPDDSKETTFF